MLDHLLVHGKACRGLLLIAISDDSWVSKFFTIFKEDELFFLEDIFNSCQSLETIKVWCGERYLNEIRLLKVVAKYSPKRFYELRIYFADDSFEFFSEELEPVLISWANRIPQIPLSLLIVNSSDHVKVKRDSMKVLENFKRLGVIKNSNIFDKCYYSFPFKG